MSSLTVLLCSAEYGEWSLHYGYLDSKPMFKGTSSQGEIHFRIHIAKTDFVWICGSQKENFLHSTVHVDLNVQLDDEQARRKYVPSALRKHWTNTKYVGFECKAIRDLPKGSHVVSVSMNGTAESKVATLTHIIMWQ